MFAVSAKIKEGEFKGRLLFFNRVILGNSSPKWTDAQAIKSVITWVNKMVAEGDAPVEFINYPDFEEQILDVYQSVKDSIEMKDITYAYPNTERASILCPSQKMMCMT